MSFTIFFPFIIYRGSSTTDNDSTAKRTLKFYFIIIVITAETEFSGATMIASPYTRPGNDIQLFFAVPLMIQLYSNYKKKRRNLLAIAMNMSVSEKCHIIIRYGLVCFRCFACSSVCTKHGITLWLE